MLVWAALLPAFLLLGYIYKIDKIEKEPLGLLFKLLILGALSCIPAILLEEFAEAILTALFEEGTTTYILVEAFLGVALMEEFCKYMAVRLGAWKHRAFNYRFDAIVYSVAAALGFAALENLLYVLENGLDVAFLRALTAVPGHAIGGLIMGIYLAEAKSSEVYGDKRRMRRFKRLAILLPVLEHGIYDAALEFDSEYIVLFWILFVVVIDIWAWKRVRKEARRDQRL